jgi:uncharacterized membrane protein
LKDNKKAITHKSTLQKVSLWVMAFAYFFAGLGHFFRPEMYLAMMPPFLPSHLALIYISGVAESGLALALIFPSVWPSFLPSPQPSTREKIRHLAAWGIIALLVAVFPANVYMYMTGGAGYDFPHWLLVARLPLQGLLIYWAYTHTKK